ncbi:MAG: hypothetical protein WAM82_23135 [Thermoanaerobaculia bacterium]
MQEEHRLKDEYFPRLRRAYFARGVPFAVVAVSLGLFLGLRQSGDWTIAAVMIVLFSGMIGVTVKKGLQKQMDGFRTFRIVLDDDSITRIQDGLPDITLRGAEIRRIVEVTGRGIGVYGQGMLQQFNIPWEIEGFERLRQRLEQWQPVVSKEPKSYSTYLIALAVLAPLAGLVVVETAQSKAVILGVGIPVLVVYAFCGVVMFRSPNVDKRSRKVAWLMLLLILVLVVKIWSALRPLYSIKSPPLMSSDAPVM